MRCGAKGPTEGSVASPDRAEAELGGQGAKPNTGEAGGRGRHYTSIQVRSSTASPVPTPEEMLLAGTNSQTCLKGQRLSSRLLLKQTQGMGAQVGGGGSQPELSWNQTRKPCFPGGPRVPEITLSLQCDNGRSLHRKVAGSKGQSLHPSRLLVPKESQSSASFSGKGRRMCPTPAPHPILSLASANGW